LIGDVKMVLARGPVTATWLSLVHDEMQGQVGDLVDRDEVDAGDGE
jgi:hypothetical protein